MNIRQLVLEQATNVEFDRGTKLYYAIRDAIDEMAKSIRVEIWFSGIDNSQPGSPHFHPASHPGRTQGKPPEWYEKNKWIYVGGVGNSNSTVLYYADPETWPTEYPPQRTDVRGGKTECVHHALKKAVYAAYGVDVGKWM